MTYADLSNLPPVPRHDATPDDLRGEIVGVIEAAILGAPRSHQRKVGPSEIGHPCDRRLGYRLLGVPKTNDRAGWRPTVGTAVHAWLADTFVDANEKWRQQTGETGTRWLVEMRVDVGDDVTGSCDLYDRATATLIDWKIVATTTLRSAKASGPSQQYRTQAHLYGRGWTRRGMPVERVGIYYLPSSGELSEGHLWTEAYDETVATAALERLARISALVEAFGEKALTVLPCNVDEATCRYCPWFLPAATDLTEACPGPDRKAATPAA